MEKKHKFDTKTRFLYTNFQQMLDIYRDPIVEAYEKVFHGSFTDEKLTPAELCDSLAMVMYEVEADDNEQ